MTIGTNTNIITWASSTVMITGTPALVLAANTERAGALFEMDCSSTDACILLKTTSNTVNEGIALYREGVGVAIFQILEYEITPGKLYTGDVWAWKQSGTDTNLYITEYQSV
jgi:hypothetical protein